MLTLTPFYPSSEDERGGFVSDPLGELAELGVRCSVVAVRPWYKKAVKVSEQTPLAFWVRYAALPGNQGLASAGRLLYWRLRNLMRRLHRANPIHVLHAHAALPCGEAARRLGRELGVAVVVTVHGLDAYLTEQVRGVAGEQCARGCRRAYQEAARVICISEEVRRQVLAGSPLLRNTEVVYNGVDTALGKAWSRADCKYWRGIWALPTAWDSWDGRHAGKWRRCCARARFLCCPAGTRDWEWLI